MSFRYINNISERLKKCNQGYIDITYPDNTRITISLIYNDGDFSDIYVANIISNDNINLQINIPNCDYKDFAYVYLYAIITIQMILNKVITSPTDLIDNFIKFVSQFNFNKTYYTYEGIINSGIFNVKYCEGDCEINSAFLAYLLNNYNSNDIIEFGNIKLFKEQLYPWNLDKTFIQFKIIVYILFMKFIVGHRILREIGEIEEKLTFDKNLLPYNSDNFGRIDELHYLNNYNENKFIELALCYHSFIITYLPRGDYYEIYDLNKKDSKIIIYQYPLKTYEKNETWFNLINCNISEDSEFSHFAVATQTNHIIEYNCNKISFDGKYNFDISLTFNQFKYILLGYIALDIYRMSGEVKNGEANGIGINDDISYEIIKKMFYNPTSVNHVLLSEMIHICDG